MDFQPVTPKLEHLFRVTASLSSPVSAGKTPSGERRMVAITGGTFKGKKFSGNIIPGGADWQIIRPDGSAVLEAHYMLRTDDGALIYIHNRGFRNGPPEVLERLAHGEKVDPANYYFRTSPLFETGAPQYSWLNSTVGVCSAVRKADEVILGFYAVQ
jgi:hypothetical protein